MINVTQIMMQVVNVYNILRIVLLQIFFLNVIDAEFGAYHNVTNNGLMQTSERLKRASTFHRSTPPSVLTATIIDGDEEIHLRWERVDRYLFNENLPVYTAQMNSWGATHKKSNVMKDIGKTIIYHDIAHKSAVIYFENLNILNGVVGQNYEIGMLPIDELSRPLIVGERFVHRLPHHGVHEKGKLDTEQIPTPCKISAGSKRMDLGDVSSSSVNSPDGSISERFYIETLLFISYDIPSLFRDIFEEGLIEFVVTSYLGFFNAVDMVFAMLPTNNFEVYINVAGIIIEEEDGVFSEILHYPPLRHDNQQELHNDGSLPKLFERYPEHFDFPFAKDSFDLMLIFTRRVLVHEHQIHHVCNSVARNMFRQRQLNEPHSSARSIMVRSTDLFSQYPNVVHNIANTLGLDKTNPGNSELLKKNEIQCWSIMQHLNRYCSHCITWNVESISQLRKFFRDDPNRCFYLNRPRSLYPAGTPVISVSPCRQCTCFGFHSYGRESRNECPFHIPAKNCGEPLTCNMRDGHGRHRVEKSILPFDGTPCGENKVCWNEVCTSMSVTTSELRV